MPRQSLTYRKVWTVAGLAAAVALGARAALEWRNGTGWPMLLVAVALVAAILMRRTTFRD